MLHDLGGLALARRARGPLVLVVVNNDGGRIFEELPIADAADRGVFERCFATPHGLDFEAFARGMGIAYAAPRTRTELANALAAAHAATGATLIEAKVVASGSAANKRKLWANVDRAIGPSA
jgi:2-succinyl-5-enolpyruvyl-6-hydroxy-3-cyclohexene-1-carboxylate synthase